MKTTTKNNSNHSVAKHSKQQHRTQPTTTINTQNKTTKNTQPRTTNTDIQQHNNKQSINKQPTTTVNYKHTQYMTKHNNQQ